MPGSDGLHDLRAYPPGKKPARYRHSVNAHANKLYRIGIKQCPKSTLADANERRDWLIYEEYAKSLMLCVRQEYAKTELAMKEKSTQLFPKLYSSN